ncbi:IS4 family transposase, partial [Arthrospira sp. O9.13F]
FEAIGRLRSDANLKFLYDGPHTGRGRPRRYDGKVDLTDPSRLTFVTTLDEGVSLYTAVVWSVNFRRPVRLAYLLKEQDGRCSYVVLFSTDVTIDPLHLYRCYTARFQIEFIFRDARQFLGFSDCQARSAEALDSHVNASLMALNLAKATLQSTQSTHTDAEPLSFSITSLKRLALNEHLFDLFIDMLDLDPTLIKSHPKYSELLSYGSLSP